jgi:hypothetical protein
MDNSMAKNETQVIQKYIYDLGKELGFHAEIEYSFGLFDNCKYEPRYDVVWFLDLTNFNCSCLSEIFGNWNTFLKKHPIAVFEIEGLTTSSKNQIGNFANIMISPALYSFIIVNNNTAANENDTYRRGLKIYRTFKDAFGNRNVIFLDWSQVKRINLDKLKSKDKEISIPDTSFQERSGLGGEKQSKDIFNEVIKLFSKTGLCIKQNYTPAYFEFMREFYDQYKSICVGTQFNEHLLGRIFINDPVTKEIKPNKKFGDFYYLPKIDISLNFNLPFSFNLFLGKLVDNSGYDYVNYPLLAYIKNNPFEYLVSVRKAVLANKYEAKKEKTPAKFLC